MTAFRKLARQLQNKRTKIATIVYWIIFEFPVQQSSFSILFSFQFPLGRKNHWIADYNVLLKFSTSFWWFHYIKTFYVCIYLFFPYTLIVCRKVQKLRIISVWLIFNGLICMKCDLIKDSKWVKWIMDTIIPNKWIKKKNCAQRTGCSVWPAVA